MPPVKAGKLPPATVEAFADLTRHGLRVLAGAQILPPPSELRPADAVVARVSRLVYWSGPGITAPGDNTARDERQRATIRATRAVRALLERTSIPESAVITISTGVVSPILKGSAIVDFYQEEFSQRPEPFLLVPLRAWWDEARTLDRDRKG